MDKNVETNKSWKKIHAERKLLKKKRKQENLLKTLEKSIKLDEEILKATAAKAGDSIKNEEKVVNPFVSTISIAVPSSILENAQSPELRSYLAGQIARAVCIFQVDEIIVFDDVGVLNARQARGTKFDADNKIVRSSCLQLARILQYLECPQYLRKYFFPLHNDLKYSGLLNPLDAPHHLRQQNVFLYREGVTTDKKVKDNKEGCYVNVGLLNEVFVNKSLNSGIRVTVKMENFHGQNSKKFKGNIVSPSEPRLKTGIYWGYSVRIANSISEIFTKSPYNSGYDLTIGTSDKGSNVHDIEKKTLSYNHCLIVFGGLKGLETALESDDKLDIEDPALLFDKYLNVVPMQGSRTIRTEEALLISMAILQEKLKPQHETIKFEFKDEIAQSNDTGIKQNYKLKVASNKEDTNNDNNVDINDLSRFD